MVVSPLPWSPIRLDHGADNLRSFHRWQNWRKIVAMVPIVVVDRLGPSLYAAASPAGNVLAHARIPEYAAASLPGRKAPAWAFLAWPQISTILDRIARITHPTWALQQNSV